MTLQTALIGCGNIGSRYDRGREVPPAYSHAGALHLHPDCALTAIADPNPEYLVECGNRWGIQARYADYTSLFKQYQPDVAIIATPSSLRLPVIQAALAANVQAIICEKPLALTLPEAEQIAALCAAQNVPLFVNFLRRWDVGAQQLAARLPELGALHSLRGDYVNGIANNATHLIDLIHWWGGAVAQIDMVKPVYEGSPLVMFSLDNGAIGSLHPHTGYDIFGLELFFERGIVRLSEGGYRLEIRPLADANPLAQMQTLGAWQSIPSGLDDSLLRLLDNVREVVAGQGAPLCGAAEGVVVSRVLQQILDFAP